MFTLDSIPLSQSTIDMRASIVLHYMHCRTLQYNTMQCNTMQWNKMQWNKIQYKKLNTIQSNHTVQTNIHTTSPCYSSSISRGTPSCPTTTAWNLEMWTSAFWPCISSSLSSTIACGTSRSCSVSNHPFIIVDATCFPALEMKENPSKR